MPPRTAWPSAVRRGETVAVFGDYDVDGACSARADGHVFCAGSAARVLHACARPHGRGLRPQRAGVAGAGGARGDADRVRRLRHRRRRGVGARCTAGRHGGAGPPQGRRPAAAGGGDRQSQPARLQLAACAICAPRRRVPDRVATLRALRRRGFFAARPEPDLLALLDLVALATVCDVMPLTGLNRALVTQGLKVMARRARPGIAALLEVAQVRGRPTAMTLGFALGPRINAAGRISEADLGLRLLLCEDRWRRGRWRRRWTPSTASASRSRPAMLEAAMQAAERRRRGPRRAAGGGRAWHPGVVGIVAGRIKERFNRPACVARHRGRHGEGLRAGRCRGSTSARR